MHPPPDTSRMSCGVYTPGRDEYIAMGLFHVAKAVAFLNNDCKLVSLAVHRKSQSMVPHHYRCCLDNPASIVIHGACQDICRCTCAWDPPVHGCDELARSHVAEVSMRRSMATCACALWS